MIYLYKILGEYFLTPQDALAYARNMGLEGPVVVRPVRIK